MNPGEEESRGLLSRATDEAPDATGDPSRIEARAHRYQFLVGVSVVLIVGILAGGSVFTTRSLLSAGGSRVAGPAQATRSPARSSASASIAESHGPPPEPNQSVPTIALITGSGRIPLGDVSLCPTGDLAEAGSITEDDVVSVSRDVLEAANAPEPDIRALWDLLDHALQEAYGSEDHFAETISSASLDDFDEWEISDRVSLEAGPILGDVITGTCGEEVAKAIVFGQAYFPKFEGASGGSAQLYFTVRDSGLRFWLLD